MKIMIKKKNKAAKFNPTKEKFLKKNKPLFPKKLMSTPLPPTERIKSYISPTVVFPRFHWKEGNVIVFNVIS